MKIDRLTKESIVMNTNKPALNSTKLPAHKGKIIRGTNFHAFNKQNLGSIPSKEETIIVKLNDKVKAFNSCTERFKGDNYNYNPGPGAYFAAENSLTATLGLNVDNCTDLKSYNVKSNESNNVILNPSCSSNSFMADASISTVPLFEQMTNLNNESNVFTKQANSIYHLKAPSHDSFIKHTFNYKLNPISSNFQDPSPLTSRFSDKTLYNKMYSPGPGQYKMEDSSFVNSKDIRYKRLFKLEEHNKIDKQDVNKSMVGPGYYYPEFYWDSTKYDLNPNIFSQSPARELYKASKELNIDSGLYFDNIMKLDESAFARTKVIRNRSHMFLDRSFESTFNIIKNTNQPIELKRKKVAHYLASKELGRVYLNKSQLPSVGDYSFPSSFKILAEKKPRENEGVSCIRASPSMKSLTNQHIKDNTSINQFKKKQEERKLIQKSHLIEKDYKKCISSNSSVFRSNLPKLPDFRNHMPGPAYYKHEVSEFSPDNIRKKIRKDG